MLVTPNMGQEYSEQSKNPNAKEPLAQQPPLTFGATRVSKSDLKELADARTILPKVFDLFVPPKIRMLTDEQADKLSQQFGRLEEFFTNNNSLGAHTSRQILINGVNLALSGSQSVDNYTRHLIGVAVDALRHLPISESGLQRRQLLTLVINSNLRTVFKNNALVLLVNNSEFASNSQEKWALYNTIKLYVDGNPELKDTFEEFLSRGDDSDRGWEIRERLAKDPRFSPKMDESEYYFHMSFLLDGLQSARAWGVRQEIITRSTTDKSLRDAVNGVLQGIKGMDGKESLDFRRNNSHLFSPSELLESLRGCKSEEAKVYQNDLIVSANKNIKNLSTTEISHILDSTRDLDSDAAWAFRITAVGSDKIPIPDIIRSVSGKHKSEGAQDFWEYAVGRPGARNFVLAQLEGNSAPFVEKLRQDTFDEMKKTLPNFDHDTLFSLCFSLRGVKTVQADKIRESLSKDAIPLPYRVVAGGGVFTDVESQLRRSASIKFATTKNPTALEWGEVLLSAFRPNEYEIGDKERLSSAIKQIRHLD